MVQEKLAPDWLANNVVIAFVGALLLGKSRQNADESIKILRWFEVPTLPEFIVVGLISVLVILSAFLSSVSVVQRLRKIAFKTVDTFELALELLVWIAFTVGYLTAASELPYDQLWAYLLFFGGSALFYSYRFATHSISGDRLIRSQQLRTRNITEPLTNRETGKRSPTHAKS